MARIYFDSNVYGFIDAAGEAQSVAQWLSQSGHYVVASVEANVGEALRIPDPNERRDRIRVITTVARQRAARPIDLVDAEEFLAELGRCRPGWILREPTAAGKTSYLELQRRQWNQLKKNASYLPRGASTVLTILHAEFGLNRTRQRVRQQQIQSGGHIPPVTTDASLLQAIARLSWRERHIRYQLSGEWYYQLKEPKTASAASSWLLPSLRLNRMFAQPGDDWFRFWMENVKLSKMPTTYLSALVEHLQLQQSIDIGNTVDRIHAGYLMQSEKFVTADKAFFGIIQAAATDVPYPATALLIENKTGASALAELQRVI